MYDPCQNGVRQWDVNKYDSVFVEDTCSVAVYTDYV